MEIEQKLRGNLLLQINDRVSTNNKLDDFNFQDLTINNLRIMINDSFIQNRQPNEIGHVIGVIRNDYFFVEHHSEKVAIYTSKEIHNLNPFYWIGL